VAVITLAFGACMTVRVDRDKSRAEAYFDQASREIVRLEKQDPHHERRPHRLYILVLDAGEGEIVRVSLPLWLVKWGLDAGMKDDADGHDFNARKRYDFAWKAVRDLDRFGQGLLVSLEENRDRVLIWLK
jgi:hypothetical protein